MLKPRSSGRLLDVDFVAEALELADEPSSDLGAVDPVERLWPEVTVGGVIAEHVAGGGKQ
jgi:hypothetical protein